MVKLVLRTFALAILASAHSEAASSNEFAAPSQNIGKRMVDERQWYVGTPLEAAPPVAVDTSAAFAYSPPTPTPPTPTPPSKKVLQACARVDHDDHIRMRGDFGQFQGYASVIGPEGVNDLRADHGQSAAPNPDPPEVQLRIGVRASDRNAVDRFSRELIPLVLSGPPGATGYGEGRPAVREVVAYWPALVPRSEIQPRVEVIA
jgi:hypothetical protein